MQELGLQLLLKGFRIRGGEEMGDKKLSHLFNYSLIVNINSLLSDIESFY